jgi:hypothetical protein
VRRVFASATTAPAYGYDPYGNALQGTTPLTDFGYAGMFYNADRELYLTRHPMTTPVCGSVMQKVDAFVHPKGVHRGCTGTASRDEAN